MKKKRERTLRELFVAAYNACEDARAAEKRGAPFRELRKLHDQRHKALDKWHAKVEKWLGGDE